MKMIKGLLCLGFIFIIIVIGNTVIVAQPDMKAPIAKKEPKVLKIHGYEITHGCVIGMTRKTRRSLAISKTTISILSPIWARTRDLQTAFTTKCSDV
jgi:hypothetical protein